MKPILGHDADDTPLREGDRVTISPSPSSAEESSTAVVAGLSAQNNLDDAVQLLHMTDDSVAYDVHCLRRETDISH